MQHRPVNVPMQRGENTCHAIYLQSGRSNIERPLLLLFLVCLHHVSFLEVLPTFETHTTFGTLSHLLNILLDVLQRSDGACVLLVQAIEIEKCAELTIVDLLPTDTTP